MKYPDENQPQGQSVSDLPSASTPAAKAKAAVGKKAATKKGAKPTAKPADKRQTPRKVTKTEQALALLRRPGGCTLSELMKATKWQQHSVRGFLSGTVKKRLGLKLTSDASEDGRRYKVPGTPIRK
jgi:hypothetical protein